MNEAGGRLLLYAPNVHTGGGLVLLEALLAAWPASEPLHAWLDERARHRLSLPEGSKVQWVLARLGSRLAAEWSLCRAATAADRVLCFHGLPSLLPSAARMELFQQNRNYLGQVPLSVFGWRTRQRLRFEQALSRWGRRRVHTYWVQTPSMAEALRQWWGEDRAGLDVRVLPFVPVPPASVPDDAAGTHYDFVYVADGEAHKNHRRLVLAWTLLASQGLRPSLALTLSERDGQLSDWIQAQCVQHGLRIHQLGSLSYAQVQGLYRRARALVFPSLGESFGLPLLEAQSQGCAIVASELDFVRDVCEPVQTFDPHSPVSIARALRRFLQQPERPAAPANAEAFLRALLG
ncbi:MAG: hypothetical protein RI988_3198 [Pseudomonadota bacterium]